MTELSRYNGLAITLHWAMALGVLFMIGSGLYMVNADIPKADQFKLYQIHKAAGVVMLVAFVLRLLTRSFSTPPSLPMNIPEAEQRLAKLGHFGLYFLLFLLPFSGWIMVSASPFGLPTFVFVDWIKWPHIPGIARNKEIEALANTVHWYGFIVLVVFVVTHVGAVVWHRKKQGVRLIERMWWKR
ncbi:cytochrome b/b6 domain-containing protein [Alteromonas sp. KUL49]|uniref:cytochrome b n=1 Tax=Alteromonas sp. KUL49 TaxID=2480798 RepID=UPI00102F1DD7|nr:cytochrome b/b6 domain-containing protein [Alteromonas sp. KUL49]TAP34288.1 cytochrome b [Alteromonas sp. KUL49]GEA13598.1 hypothetical protein KUL49_39730 [Alteromonas sp. KUL49]